MGRFDSGPYFRPLKLPVRSSRGGIVGLLRPLTPNFGGTVGLLFLDLANIDIFEMKRISMML